MSETTETIEPAALMDLYRRIAARQAAKAPTLREMRERSPEEHAAYMREANRKSRAKAREAKANGSPEPTKAMVRDALADAALILLASGGPGAEEIRNDAPPGVPRPCWPARPDRVGGPVRQEEAEAPHPGTAGIGRLKDSPSAGLCLAGPATIITE